MMIQSFLKTCALGVIAAGLVSCDKPAETSGGPGEGMRVAVIPKGTTHVFWKSVEAGANDAGKELGVKISWKGPLKENDRAQQISIIEQFVSEGVSGIVLAPLDDTALQRPVQAAMQKKIPVVIIDSALKGNDFVSFVATDNRQGGRLAGEQIVKLLGGKGKVAMLRYQEGSASTIDREEGFLEVMKQNPGMQVIVDNRYAGATAGEAQTTAMNMLDSLRSADGIFASNESTAFGMLLALRQTGLAGKVKFVGFDTSPPLIDGLKKGDIQALIAQNPRKMGYEGVKTLVTKLKGGEVPARVDTGVAVITTENLESTEIKALLQ